MELFLHASNLRRNDVSQGFVHDRCHRKLHLDGLIKLDEVLAVWHGDFRGGHYLLKEYVLCLVFTHLGELLGLFQLILEICIIVRWDLGHDGLATFENLLRSVSRSSSLSHLFTLLLRLGKSMYAQDLPGARFEIFAMVEQNICP